MNENLTVTTTSPTTAETTPLSLTPLDADATLQTIESSEDMEAISIKQTDRVRLVFKPTIIRDPNKKFWIKGDFLYQKKGKADEWQDVDTVKLSSLKKGEGVRLSLTSDELGEFLRSVGAIFSSKMNLELKQGKSSYVKVDYDRKESVQKLLTIKEHEIDEILDLRNGDSFNIMKKVAQMLTNSKHSDLILSTLSQLPADDISKLNAITGITTLKASLEYWEKNKHSKDEGMWQKYFEENPYILSNILCIPAYKLKGGAYTGGKSVFNQGGNLVDFMFKSAQTENPVLIEIKTPETKIIGEPYRQTYSMSSEVSGSVGQILNYSNMLVKNAMTLLYESRNDDEQIDVFKPLLYVILGNTKELTCSSKKEAFELYRNNLKDVQIITFDEVFEKVSRLIETLESQS
ncbi:Shedu immune nuclease family protein [Vibrio harveyi]|uniref:Shedu immune nuclease family protein n=2 Tax=Vibrio harveyi TaxID=669 RepID=UPI000C7B13B2|nr:Shedu immune nuclease family protein [Vibrio harveyi]GBL00337.1 hypothetical protein VH1709_contig00047-0158 [Vibrio harveyi]HDM8057771.1 DUF4263 domain-containing protein [Vibrio harveyi]